MKTGGALIADINKYRPGKGEAAFWWLGQLSFAVKTADATLYFDPFLSDQIGRVIPSPLRPEEITNADYIFGSHDHIDHIDRDSWPALSKASPNAKFIVPDLLKDRLSGELHIAPGRFIGVDLNISYQDDKISVRGLPAAHELLDADPATGRHPYMGFVAEAGGLKIYHSGDSCVYEGMLTALRKFGSIDLMMLPINGRDGQRLRRGCIGNMSFAEAADLAGALAPGLVVPAHYDMFTGNRYLLEAMLFMEMLEAKYPNQKFWIGAHAEKVILRRGE